MVRAARALGLYSIGKIVAQRFLERGAEYRRRRDAMLNFFKQFVNENDVCFDIGANVGNWTDVFVRLGASVIAVEPQSECADLLRRRFAKTARVHVVEAGAGARQGTGEMFICEDAGVLSTFSSDWVDRSRFARKYHWFKRQNVRMTTVDDLISCFGVPSLCKIDVEGFEVNVLAGLSQPIRFIVFEFVGELLDQTRCCIERIATLGEYEFNLSLAEKMRLASTKWMNKEQLLLQLGALENGAWGDIVCRMLRKKNEEEG